MDTNELYTVIGGDSPGIFHKLPFLSSGNQAPILPIVIKCTSMNEASAILDLHSILDSNQEMFAKALAQSNQIANFTTIGPFYAVYRGKTRPRMIYVQNYHVDVEPQVHGYPYAKFHRFDTLKDALVYMILKGDITTMKNWGLFPLNPHRANQSTTARTEPALGPVIYSHIRDTSGIIDTIYGTTTGHPDFKPQDLGRHASYYLQAHGYLQETIDEITEVWLQSHGVEEFVAALNPQGMPATELRWLWDLIDHSDDCNE
ncbi:hypothetical protein B0H14DRAFT_2580863 [Mycena olivaceomarginata]|nr:hypothetical protein B0H14DRAFT_2580863 [Mycena olivaceomarginata]